MLSLAARRLRALKIGRVLATDAVVLSLQVLSELQLPPGQAVEVEQTGSRAALTRVRISLTARPSASSGVAGLVEGVRMSEKDQGAEDVPRLHPPADQDAAGTTTSRWSPRRRSRKLGERSARSA